MSLQNLTGSMRRLARGEAGAVAAEFAMIISALIVVTLGVINFSLMMYAVVTLHFAAETAARCAAIGTCSNSYVSSFPYAGPAISPTFTVKTPAPSCGTEVDANATYEFATGLASFPITIEASACHAPIS
jgi:Flp pilus assembly protein TadG